MTRCPRAFRPRAASILGDTEHVILRPDAAATQPLRIDLDEGAFPGPATPAGGDSAEAGSGAGPCWGVRARVETALGFELHSVAAGEPVARVATARVVYQAWLACPLVPVEGEEPGWALHPPYQRGKGMARVEFQVPTPVRASADAADGPAREPAHARQRAGTRRPED